jgi:hypothetical protein
MITNIFTPLFLLLFLDPGWVKIRIRDVNPGSSTATLEKTFVTCLFPTRYRACVNRINNSMTSLMRRPGSRSLDA